MTEKKTPVTFRRVVTPYTAQGWIKEALLPCRPKFKHPGRYTPQGWIGLRGQTLTHGYAGTEPPLAWEDVQDWQTRSICVLGNDYPAVDIDCSHKATNDALRSVVGDTFERRRTGSERFAVPFRAMGHVSWSPIKFTLPHSTERQMVELIGKGKQWVACGPHPKGGKYFWFQDAIGELPRGEAPSVAALPMMNQSDADRIRRDLVEKLRELEATFLEDSDKPTRPSSVGEDMDPNELDPCITHDLLAEVLKAVPDDRETVGGWDEGVARLASFRACLGREGQVVPDYVVEWADGYPGSQGPEWVEDRWNSFDTVRSGAGSLISWVKKHAPKELADRVEDHIHAVEKGIAVAGLPIEEGDDGDVPPEVEAMRAEQAARSGIVERFVYIRSEDRIIDLERDRHAYDSRNFNNAYGSLQRRAPPGPRGGAGPVLKPWERVLAVLRGAEKAASGRPTFLDGVRYEPGQGVIFCEAGETVERQERRYWYLNEWRPPRAFLEARRGVTEEHVEPYLELLRRLVVGSGGDEHHVRQVLQLLALPIARPGTKSGVILAMVSREGGTGKGATTIRPLQDALGQEAETIVDAEGLKGQFNEYLLKQVLLIPEIDRELRGGSSALFKGLNDGEGQWLTVNRKYGPKVQVRDRLNIFVNTNHIRYLPLDGNPRRWFVINADVPPLTPAEARSYWDWYEGGGRELVIGFLRYTVDLSESEGWWRREGGLNAPGTQAALRETEPIIVQELRSVLGDRQVVVQVSRLVGEMKRADNVSEFTNRNVNEHNVQEHLRTIGFVPAVAVASEKMRIDKEVRSVVGTWAPETCRPWVLAPTQRDKDWWRRSGHDLRKAKLNKMLLADARQRDRRSEEEPAARDQFAAVDGDAKGDADML